MAPARTRLARKQNADLLVVPKGIPGGSSPSFADTASRSHSQPKMEDNFFAGPKFCAYNLYVHKWDDEYRCWLQSRSKTFMRSSCKVSLAVRINTWLSRPLALSLLRMLRPSMPGSIRSRIITSSSLPPSSVA